MSATPSQRWLRRSSGFLRVISVLWIATAARASRILGSFQSGAEAVDFRFMRTKAPRSKTRLGRPMRSFKPLLCALLAVVTFGTAAPDALAQTKLINRPIRLLVPFAPGGGVDVVARVVGQKLGERIGQPVLVESKPGAGGVIAVNELMRSDADGY